jgi:hypothetical protein
MAGRHGHRATVFREQLFWESNAQFNWGGYSNPAVDAAFRQIRESGDDSDYKGAAVVSAR